jgi:hypothetical protein
MAASWGILEKLKQSSYNEVFVSGLRKAQKIIGSSIRDVRSILSSPKPDRGFLGRRSAVFQE